MDPGLCQQHLEETLKVLGQAGFVIAEDKTDSTSSISQVKEYLGFIVNSVDMTVSASTDKLNECRSLLKEAAAANQIAAKRLAKVLGKVLSIEIATGPVVQLLSRSAQHELAAMVEASHWGVTVVLSQEAKEALLLLANCLSDYNGYAIRNDSNTKPLNDFIGASEETQGRSIYGTLPGEAHAVLASDASSVAACTYGIKNAGDFFVQAEQSHKSSGHRELLAVLAALRTAGETISSKGGTNTVFWLTDSSNLVHFLTKGLSLIHI